jgi:CRISP-associated protein Cas1
MTLWFPFRTLFQRPPAREVWPVPPVVDDEAQTEADARVLSPVAMPVHVLSGEALVRTRDGQLIVERPDAELFSRPMELVSSVHVYGRPGITSPCVAALLRQGTSVVWRGMHGYPVGISAPLHSAGLERRKAQYLHADGERGLDVARRLIAAKIVSSRGLLRRQAPSQTSDVIDTLARLAQKARKAQNREQLLGFEGAAAAAYFSARVDLC